MWSFATVVENAQQEAVDRLPESAKPKAHERARERVLLKYLGIEDTETKGRFRAPG